MFSLWFEIESTKMWGKVPVKPEYNSSFGFDCHLLTQGEYYIQYFESNADLELNCYKGMYKILSNTLLYSGQLKSCTHISNYK